MPILFRRVSDAQFIQLVIFLHFLRINNRVPRPANVNSAGVLLMPVATVESKALVALFKRVNSAFEELVPGDIF